MDTGHGSGRVFECLYCTFCYILLWVWLSRLPQHLPLAAASDSSVRDDFCCNGMMHLEGVGPSDSQQRLCRTLAGESCTSLQ